MRGQREPRTNRPAGPVQLRTPRPARGYLGPTPALGPGANKASGLRQAPRRAAHLAPPSTPAGGLDLFGHGLGHAVH
eukprot:15454892-Alexandrium_andersonii.AAC.1